MIDININDFLSLSESDMVPYIGENAVIFSQQYDRKHLDYLCILADACRKIHKFEAGSIFLRQLLRDKACLNFFVQPSSRTFLSFNTAESILGMSRMSVRDEKISSISKGETLADSIRTFISYVDLVVMRHSQNDACSVAYWVSAKAHRRLLINGKERPVPIVSAGSGTKQHPTQALLDIYTLEKSFEKVGGIDNKTIMFVGDLKRGRTVRSLSYLMKNYRNVTLLFCSPEKYKMQDDIIEFLNSNKINYNLVSSISEGIADSDAIYMTRIQDEHDNLSAGIHTKTQDEYIFKMKHLDEMKPNACLLHPLPKRDEIEPEVDFANDPRVIYWRQERNGMWMRTAIIAKLFEVDKKIIDFAQNA